MPVVSQQEPCILSNDAADVILQQDSATLGRQAAKLSAGTGLPIAIQTNLQRWIKTLLMFIGILFRKKNQIFSESTRTAYLHWPRKLIISISECRNGSNGSDRDEYSKFCPSVNNWWWLPMTTAYWPNHRKVKLRSSTFTSAWSMQKQGAVFGSSKEKIPW